MAGSHGRTARMYLLHGSGRRGATGGGGDSSWRAGRGRDWESEGFEGLEGSEGEEGKEGTGGAVRRAAVNRFSVPGVLWSLLDAGTCELRAESGLLCGLLGAICVSNASLHRCFGSCL